MSISVGTSVYTFQGGKYNMHEHFQFACLHSWYKPNNNHCIQHIFSSQICIKSFQFQSILHQTFQPPVNPAFQNLFNLSQFCIKPFKPWSILHQMFLISVNPASNLFRLQSILHQIFVTFVNSASNCFNLSQSYIKHF